MKRCSPLSSILLGFFTFAASMAHAANWQKFRTSENVEDRRGDLAKLTKEVDSLHDTIITYGNQAAKRGHIFGCSLIDKTIPAARQAGERAKKAKPVAVVLMSAPVSADLNKVDLSGVDACKGAARAQLDVAEKAIAAAGQRMDNFDGQEVPIRASAQQLLEILRKTPVSSSEARCRVPTKKAFDEYEDYIDRTEQIHEILTGQLKDLENSRRQIMQRLAACGDKDFVITKPPGWGKEVFRSRQKSSHPDLNLKELEGTFEGKHLKE